MSRPASCAARSTAAQPASTIRSASDTFLPPDWALLKSAWIPSSDRQHLGQLGRIVGLPVLLRLEANPGPVRAAALVGAAEARRRRPRGGHELGDGQPRREQLVLEGGDVVVPDQLVVDVRDGVLPQLRLRDPRAEIARGRAHVPVEQLVPRPGEGVGELVGVLVEALGDRPVDRVELEGEVGRQHHRGVPLGRVVSVRHGVLGLGVLGRPLLGAGRALGELVVVGEQVVQEPVVPLRRLVGPRALEPTGERVGAVAGLVAVLPAQALVLDGTALGFGTEVLLTDCTVGLADRMAADDEGERSPRRSSPCA